MPTSCRSKIIQIPPMTNRTETMNKNHNIAPLWALPELAKLSVHLNRSRVASSLRVSERIPTPYTSRTTGIKA
jgi:hypothetical protein